jgi:3-phenylpropionate/trans-cinnamate dioxygenase ferredoxin reductase subunit
MTNRISRILIIGAGQAGAWAAHTLRQNGFEGELALVSNEESVFYERPPLSKQVLAGQMDAAATQLFSTEAIEAMNIQWHKPDTAVAIDRVRREVRLASGKLLGYDKLMLTTGSRARVPVKAWAEIDGVYTVRTIADAARLGKKLQPGRRMAIIGGGWIGLEVAATARKQGLEVTVFELGERLCARSVAPQVSDFLYQLHSDQGVDVQLSCGAIELAGAADGAVRVSAAGIAAGLFDAVVVGAGAEIASELGREAGLDTTSGLVVDACGKTSDADIYAAGDVAIHPELGYCIQSWANAQNQAISAALSLLGQDTPYADVPWLWSDQYHCNIQILGAAGSGEGTDIRRVCGDNQQSFIRLDAEDRLESLIAVNDPKLIKLGKRWIKAGMKLPAEILADPAQNLMTLKP